MTDTELWQRLKCAEKPIVLYGMGNGADKVLDLCDQKHISVRGVFASDGFARHNLYRGFPVISYTEAKQQFGDMIVLLCFGTQRSDVISYIEAIAAEQELYCPDVPVVGRGLFCDEYAQKQTAYAALRSHLADAQSRLVLDCLLAYRLSGKISYLKQCETPPEEAFENILKLSDQEEYLDLGAYTGDTVREFLAHTNGYRSICAVEPDRRSFQKLQANAPFARCIHAAAAAQEGTVRFMQAGGRQSAVNQNGTSLPAISIDSLHTAFSYIKMDVEGSEADAIRGGTQTISVYKPKLNIAAYHRTEDYLSIFQQVMNLRPDYRVFMRHHPYIPAWDTNFYFI